MNEDDDLVLNAKAIGLAVGGAALAGMLFVLTRRDEKATPSLKTAASPPVKDTFAEAAREAAREAQSQREAAEDVLKENGKSLQGAVTSPSGDVAALERELKAAAWEAQERARIAEGKFRAASSRVAEDAAHLATRVGEEARHLAGEGKGRIPHLRRPGSSDSGPGRTKDRPSARHDEPSGKDRLGVKKKLAGKKVGPLPEGVAGEAASAALENLEKSLKSKAPLLLAARNKAQAMEIVQRELGPILRDSALLALSTAIGSAERASKKAATTPEDLKQRFRPDVEQEGSEDVSDVEERVRAAHEAATAEALRARDEAEAEARAARAEADRLTDELAARLEEIKQAAAGNGSQDLLSSYEPEPVAVVEVPTAPEPEPEADIPAAQAEEAGKRGVSGLLWGGAGLGLAIYALMDAERRESVLKFANEASVQMQELVRDLQGYDDEF